MSATEPNDRRQTPVVDAELVDLDALTAQPLRYPPAVIPTCRCGNGTDRGHGLIPGRERPFTCDEVLAIRARVEGGQTPRRRPLIALLRRGGA